MNFGVENSHDYQFPDILMNKGPKFKGLWKAFKLDFVLFHGQALTKLGFNVNKDMLVENL